MIDYKAANPDHSLDQFNTALKTLDAETRKVRFAPVSIFFITKLFIYIRYTTHGARS